MLLEGNDWFRNIVLTLLCTEGISLCYWCVKVIQVLFYFSNKQMMDGWYVGGCKDVLWKARGTACEVRYARRS